MLGRRRRSLAGSRIAVTGASGGIGLALAEELARRGARLVLNARREDVLRDIAEKLKARGADVAFAHPATSPTKESVGKLLAAAAERFGGLDILVNNAGIGAFGRFAEADPANLRRILEVDFFATAELTRRRDSALARRDERRPSSTSARSWVTAAFRTPPSIAPRSSRCAASAKALRPELAKLGIDLLLVSPGTTDTGFFDNVLAMRVKLPWRKKERAGVAPAKVAVAAADALERIGRKEIIPSAGGRAMVLANRFFPGIVDWWLARYG